MAGTPKFRPGPLKDIDGIRSELSRLYRGARNGDITTERASALAALLGDIRRCLNVDDASVTPQARGRRFPLETKT